MSFEMHQRAAALAAKGEEERQPLNPSSSSGPSESAMRKRDLRFEMELQDRVPWSSIALALFLLILGTACFVIAYLIHQGHTGGKTEQMISFTVVGFITFLPGYFESRNAYYAFRKAKGYKFHHIPQF